jgi:hypothetical protein
MKASEWKERQAVRRVTASSEHDAKIFEFLASLPDVPAHSTGDLQDPAHNFEASRTRIRTLLRSRPRGMRLLSIECDHCGTRLVDLDVGSSRASSPPCFQAGCAACGWLVFLDCEARRAE